jgi:hypothetical protein
LNVSGSNSISDYNEAKLKSAFELLLTQYLGQNLDEAFKIVENVYLPSNIAANNSLAWFKAYSDVSYVGCL